jgi:hypothetical protein
MVDYQLAKIYKITTSCGKCYYGSTTRDLKIRFRSHKADVNHNKSTASSELFKIDPEPKIELVEEYPCSSKTELRHREQFWIENNECVNKYKAYRSDPEKDDKEYDKKSYEKNCENRKERVRSYYASNKETINATRNVKIQCDCGGSFSSRNRCQHLHTQKHQAYLTAQATDA